MEVRRGKEGLGTAMDKDAEVRDRWSRSSDLTAW